MRDNASNEVPALAEGGVYLSGQLTRPKSIRGRNAPDDAVIACYMLGGHEIHRCNNLTQMYNGVY